MSKAPTTAELKHYRAIAHKLHPIVTIAGAGLSEGVLGELERALADHELIKIKVAVGDREARDALLTSMLATTRATLIQRIGNTATILRPAPHPDARKSNLLRPI